MSTETYPPAYPDNELDWRREVTRMREEDVADFDNLPRIYYRKSSHIPTGSSDVLDQDKVGDIAFQAGFLYILVDDSGNVKWQRTALADF